MVVKAIRGKKILSKYFVVCVALVLSFFLFKYIMRLTDLRPIADDYCSISTSHDGPLSASLKYFANVNGDLWAMFLYSLFVGYPIIIFGIPFGSACAHIVLLLALIFLMDNVFKAITRDEPLSYLERYLLALCVVLSWFQYWMLPRAKNVPLFFEFDGNLRLLSESVLHWKTVQIMYLTVPISIIFLTLLIRKTLKSTYARNVAFFIVAIVTGLSGYIFAATSILTIIFVWYFKKFTEQISRDKLPLYSAGILLGFCVSFFSPGSVARKQALNNYPNLDIPVSVSLEHAFLTGTSMLLNPGVLSSLLSGFILGFLLRKPMSIVQVGILRDLKNTLLFSLITSFLVVSAANHRVGWSAWHMLLPFALNWVFWLLVGLSWNSRIPKKLQLSTHMALIFYGVFVLSAALGIQTAVGSVNARLFAWEIGPAPTSGIEDREVEWVRNCIDKKIYG